jgi:hypothetical protein
MSKLSDAVNYLSEEIDNAEMEGNTQDAFRGLLSAAREVLKNWEN